MNEFVNFGRRGVDLPPGCKDLIDVLRRVRRPPVPALTSRPVQGLAHVAGLANIAGHLHKLLEPGTKFKNLVITWHEEKNYVRLMNNGGVITALTVIHGDIHRERAVRGVFNAAGLEATHDEALGWVRALIYPLPAGESSIRELVSDVLRKGYGLAENVRLEIGSWEDDAS
jgi:hypothetical protein